MLRKYSIELLIVLAIHAGFLVYQFIVQHDPTGEAQEYLITTDNLRNEGTLYSGDLSQHIEPERYTAGSPGYPFFLLVPRLFTQSLVPVVLLQMLLSLLSFVAMLRIFQPEGYARILLTAFVLLYPAQFIYPNLVLPEILFQFLLVMAALTLYRYLQKEQFRMAFAYQLMIVLAILVRPAFYPFIILNILLFTVLYYRYRQRLLVISSLIPVVFIIIFASINQQRTGYFHVSSSHATHLVNDHLQEYLTDRQGIEKAVEITGKINADCGEEKDFSKRSDCLARAALEIIKEEPLTYAWFQLRKVGTYFIAPGRDALYQFFGMEDAGNNIPHDAGNKRLKAAWTNLQEQPYGMIILLLAIMLVNLLRFAGFILFLFNRRIDISFRLFLFFLSAYLAFASGPLGIPAFMLPLILLVTGAAAFQYGTWFTTASQDKKAIYRQA